MDPVSIFTVVGWLVLHLGAIASAWGTRIAAGSRAEVPIQLTFLATMLAVGLSAWYCHQLELGLWVPSGITLIAMVLTAVTDFRQYQEPSRALISAK